MHGKIEPEWVDAKPPIKKTFRIPDHEEINREDLEKLDAEEVTDAEDENEGQRPAMA